MGYLLLAGAVGALIGFMLGVLVMALFNAAEPDPEPDARREFPLGQEQEAARPIARRQESGSWLD